MSASPVKFLHLRQMEWKITHKGQPVHVYKQRGGVTVAYRVEKRFIEYAFTVCSKKDAYCKKIGRDTALSRLMDTDPVGMYKSRIVKSLGSMTPTTQVRADLTNIWGI